jgi:hypothetical protein
VQSSIIIAYCTGLIAVCTVLLFVATVLTIRSYNMLRNISNGEAGAHDEAQIRLGRAARAQTEPAQRSAPVLRTRVERTAPVEKAAPADSSASAGWEPAPAAREPKAPKKRNIPIARYDSNLEETMGETEWTGPVTTYIPENRSPQKP